MKTQNKYSSMLVISAFVCCLLSSCKKEELTAPSQLPVVSISQVVSKTQTTITIKINITGVNVSQSGICWSTLPNPNITDSHTSESDISGEVITTATELLSDTVYYIRAYAINEAGIGYSEQMECWTLDTLPDYLPVNGILGWWPFNGNAKDESGNRNDFTVCGATLTENRFGLVSSAYHFDGINDYLYRSPFTDIASFSISIWVRMSNYPSSNYPHAEFISNGCSSSNGFGLKYQSGFIYIIAYGETYNVTNSSFYPDLSSWYNYVVTKTAYNYKLYVNGVLSSTGSSITNSVTGCLSLGAASPGFGNSLNGDIDDIGIWNRALTPQEITDLYNAK